MVIRESLLSYDIVKVRAHQMHDQVDILKILKCHRGSEHIQKTYHLVCVEVHKIIPRRRICILGVNRGVCSAAKNSDFVLILGFLSMKFP